MLQVFTFMEDALTVMFLAFLFSLLNYVINKKFGERDKVKALNKEVQDYQKKMQEAVKAKDDKRLEELQKEEPRMMENMKQAMMLPFKALLITLPIFIVLFSYILPALFPSFVIRLPFDIHLNAVFALQILKEAPYGAKGFFIVCSIFSGLIVEVIASNYGKIKGVFSK